MSSQVSGLSSNVAGAVTPKEKKQDIKTKLKMDLSSIIGQNTKINFKSDYKASDSPSAPVLRAVKSPTNTQ